MTPLIAYLAKNDSTDLMMLESDLTLAHGINCANIRKLERVVGKKNIIKAISYLLLRLSENFNMKGKFTSEQAAITAIDLFEIFGYESLEDVVLMFKYVRQGRIGDGKDFKLDSQAVFNKWVPQYLDLKAQERENNHNKTKGELSGMTSFNWAPEDIEKFQVNEKMQRLDQSFGKRMKEAFKTDHLPKPKLNESINLNFHKEAKADVKNRKTEDLILFLRSEEKSNPPDKVLMAIVQEELNHRNQ